MILIGLGANLPSLEGAAPVETLRAALDYIQSQDMSVTGVSPWFESAPVPVSDQPWFVNGVAELDSSLSPADILVRLHDCERHFGRARREKNAARILDIDLLAWHGLVLPDPESWQQAAGGGGADPDGLILPHPRLHLRNFVLRPLQACAPAWRHPVFHHTATQLLVDCPDSSLVRPLQSGSGSV